MRLRLQTDYALRVLLYVAFADRKTTTDEVANAYCISRDHLVKVIQLLATHGYVRTQAGRGGGFVLACDPATVTVREVVEAIEGRNGVLDCVESPDVCPLEPGCQLRGLLIEAEDAFYEVLASKTLANLISGRRRRGGLYNLESFSR